MKRLALPVAVAVFAGSVSYAAVALPNRVAVYFGPADRPDVTYQLWQFILLLLLGAAVAAVALAALATATSGVIAAFMSDRGTDGTRVGAAVAVWVLMWFTSLLWLAIWLGNSDHSKRSLYEFLVSVIALAGVPAVTIMVLRFRRS
jgi:ABC-type Fe3+-siderophore transport system permease subunit